MKLVHWTDGKQHVLIPEGRELEPGALAGTPVKWCELEVEGDTDAAKSKDTDKKFLDHVQSKSPKDWSAWLQNKVKEKDKKK
jgi:hypothetical protein